MTNTFEGEFLHIKNPSPHYAEYIWQAATANLEAESYHAQNDIILEFVTKHQIRKHLLDAREFAFPITPKVQEEVAERFFAKLIAFGDQKAAFLVPKDIFTQVSLEQVMEEETTGTLTSRYFDNYEAAKAWLEA